MRKAKIKVALAIIMAVAAVAFFAIPFALRWEVSMAVRGYVGGVLSLSLAASLGKSAKEDIRRQKESENG